MEKNITLLNDENVSGAYSFKFTRFSNLLDPLQVNNGEIEDAVPLRSGSQIYVANFFTDELSFDDKPVTRNGEECRRITISGTIYKDSLINRQLFATMRDQRYLLCYEDMNGLRLIIGEKDQGCQIEADITHGGGNGANAIKFTVSYISIGYLPVVKSTVVNPFSIA